MNPNGNPQNLVAPWKPGQSGNPKGRPKGLKNLTTILREILEIEIEVCDPTDPEQDINKKRRIKMPIGTAQMWQLAMKGAKGDLQAIIQIKEWIEGKSIQAEKPQKDKPDTKIVVIYPPGHKETSGNGKPRTVEVNIPNP